MTLARYFVFKQQNDWLVTFEGRVMAHFPTQPAAVASARGMAKLMGAMQYDADVMVEEAGKPLQQVLVYGAEAEAPRPKRRKRTAPLPRNRSLVSASAASASPPV